jgi:hypothetical protein
MLQHTRPHVISDHIDVPLIRRQRPRSGLSWHIAVGHGTCVASSPVTQAPTFSNARLSYGSHTLVCSCTLFSRCSSISASVMS